MPTNQRPWENDSCETVQACYSVYHVSVAAALWCGVPPSQVESELSKASPIGQSNALGRAILSHPYLKCLEPRMRAIHAAIDSGELPSCREDGRKVGHDDHVSYGRRHVHGLDLKEWAKSISPSERPDFLFDEIERNAHPNITADTYNALKAERDRLEKQLEKAAKDLREAREQKNSFEMQCKSLEAMVNKIGAPGERAESTYQNIIAALLDCIAGSLPGIEKHPSFSSEAKLIEAIDEHYRGYGGLSQSNLSRKFPEAKKALRSR